MKRLTLISILIAIVLNLNSQNQTIELFSDHVPGSNFHPFNEFFVWESKSLVFFDGYDETNGVELWVSDGSVEGTRMVKNICTGFEYEDVPCGSSPNLFTAMGNYVYFVAYTIESGHELWRTDGTEEGTHMVKDIFPGAGGSLNPTSHTMVVYNNELYFAAKESLEGGIELWKSDGSEAGTVMVTDLLKESNKSSIPSHFAIHNNLLYFVTTNTPSNKIYSTDGTEEGTQLVFDINPNGSGFIASLESHINKLFFKGGEPVYDVELYCSDGTTEGTFLLKDISENGGSIDPTHKLVTFNNEVYFAAYSSGYGTELWKSDGTSEGTVLVKDINPTFESYALSSQPRNFTVFNGQLFFSAAGSEFNRELWVTDGTSEGTRLFYDLWEKGEGFPVIMAEANNRLYFFGRNNGFVKLFSFGKDSELPVIHNGTEFEYNSASLFFNHYVLNDTLFFRALLKPEYGPELYMLTNNNASDANTLVDVGSTLYPNPFNESIYISNFQDVQRVRLTNLSGVTVLHEPVTSSRLCTGNLDKGIYIATLYLYNGTKYKYKLFK
jgi:ELWxxDGT repeat protein